MKTGVVKFFNREKGFGFIVADSGNKEDVFVHVTGLTGGVKELNKQDKVQYNEFDGKKGIQAKDVTVIKG